MPLQLDAMLPQHLWQTYAALTSPNRCATRVPLQVAHPFGGGSAKTAKMRRSVAVPYRGGRPSRTASSRPASPWCAKRVRHLLTRAAWVSATSGKGEMGEAIVFIALVACSVECVLHLFVCKDSDAGKETISDFSAPRYCKGSM